MRLSLLLLLAGCAAEPEPLDAEVDVVVSLPAQRNSIGISWTVVLDSNVPAWEEEEVRAAARAWEAHAPCAMIVTVEHGIVSRGPDDPLPDPFVIEVTMGTPPTVGAVGWTKTQPNTGTRIILLPNASDADRDDFTRVAQHELGHAFIGDDHGGYVMAAPAIKGARVNEEDAELYGTRWCAK